jgi:RimJ/RimL family protein N-acetyltransferase
MSSNSLVPSVCPRTDRAVTAESESNKKRPHIGPASFALEESPSAVELLDGTRISYHPIHPDNTIALQRFHRGLSQRSIYLRFFSAKPQLSAQTADYFTHLDMEHRLALIAVDPQNSEEIIAVVRFDREGNSDRAEFAAVVADRWQGKGLGLALTRCLVEAAHKRDIRVFTCIVLPENKRMLNLLRDLKLSERVRSEEGVEYVEVLLDLPAISDVCIGPPPVLVSSPQSRL